MKDKGIDWSMGSSNIDAKTGIRYGVISQHSVSGYALDDLEPYYGEPSCPKCGNEVKPIVEYSDEHPDENLDSEEWSHAKYEADEFVCERCHYVFENAYPDEPNGFTYEEDGYSLTDCLDNDIFVLSSPYYTYTQFCSPCVPGAGNLDSPIPPTQYTAETCPGRPCSSECDHVENTGVKTYALGHDWFEEGIAPYPLYRVENGEEVKP